MSTKATKKRRSFIGIDVSKKLLEVGVHQSDYHFRCPNDPKNFPALITELISLRPARILLEATGGLERALLQALHAAGLPVVVVNPAQVRAFAQALASLSQNADQGDVVDLAGDSPVYHSGHGDVDALFTLCSSGAR